MENSKKESKKVANKRWYNKNQEAIRLRYWQRRQTTRTLIQEYKLERGCSVCGYSRSARALHFHHIGDNKEDTIAKLVGRGCSWDRVFPEIEKCIILCANCHAELHESEVI